MLEGVESPLSVQSMEEKVTTADLIPQIPEVGGTAIVLQRNAKDKDNRNRPTDSPDFGALDSGEGELTQAEAKEFFDGIFSELTEEERKTVDILVVASDATLIMPDGRTSPHRRGLETAKHVLTGLRASMAQHSISKTQSLNKTGEPIALTSRRLTDLRMLDESPNFVKYMTEKYGTGRKFWEAYEDDREKEVRLEMKAEGPTEIANRVKDYLSVVANAMRLYHEQHPGRRVIVWAVTHYDSISPFLKTLTEIPVASHLPVDYRAGVVFHVDEGNQISTEIQGQRYDLSLATHSHPIGSG